jgi:hypothetical protein
MFRHVARKAAPVLGCGVRFTPVILAALLSAAGAGCFGCGDDGADAGTDAAAPGTDASGFCGDGFCDPCIGENIALCPDDCAPVCTCGDAWCDPTCAEACDSCAQDCGACPPSGSLRSVFQTSDAGGISAFWLEFTPAASGGYWMASGCWGRTIDPAGTGDVTYSPVLADDDASAPIVLPFPLVFFGVAETDAFVSANGFLTFGAEDTGTTFTAAAHDAVRRVAPLMSDLAGGSVVVDEFADHLNVHWLGWGDGAAPGADAHLKIGADGVILFLWSGAPNVYPVIIGISDGTGAGDELYGLWPLC